MVHCDTSEYSWCLTQGDDSERVFIYQDATGAAIDLTGWVAELVIEIGLVELEIACTVDGSFGKITAVLTHAVSSTFTGNGTFKVRITSGSGAVKTLIRGELLVTP